MVTVYMSGIDDMSEIVPSNIRELLTKPTDPNGTVRFPSRLGDHYLGFDVRASGHRPLTRHYSGFDQDKIKLFVMEAAPRNERCVDLFLEEVFPKSVDRSNFVTGSLDHY